MVVVGGNGAFATTQSNVYALPLVNNTNATNVVDMTTQGTLANKNVPPTQYFAQGTQRLLHRGVIVPATTPADIFTSDSIPANNPAIVGAGPLAAGPIEDLIIVGDTVFVRVVTPAAGQNPGIFYSQALLDDQGQIASWTQWQRAAGTIQPVFGFGYNDAQATITMMFGANTASINTVQRTQWAEGNAAGMYPLSVTLAGQFPLVDGGIQGFFDVPQNAPGLNDISVIMATGVNNVALIQTGQNNAGTFSPVVGAAFENPQLFTEGTLTADANAYVVVISGGALQEVGPLVGAEIATNGPGGDQGYLFVGGAGGLAVLTDQNGQGWNTAVGLGQQFAGLTQGMSFKQVGDYPFINSLTYDDNFLYVVTDTQVYRLDLTDPTFPATTIATLESIGQTAQGTFFDGIFSDKFALLATNNGLFRVGDGNNIQTALTPTDVGWVPVIVPEGYGPVIYLQGISTTGRSQDVARGQGGAVYALSAYLGKYRAQVNRYRVNPVDTSVVDETTITPVGDLTYQNTLTSFINFGGPRNLFTTDGAFDAGASNRDLIENPYIKAGRYKKSFVTIPVNVAEGSAFAAIVRNSTLGSWLIAGDMGLRVNE